MNLRSVDLNLLVMLDALLAERHVTRAAYRVSMSQSAMSNALSRLRHIFKDELFVRNGGLMEPTARALALAGPLSQILRQTERMMSADVAFDPHRSERQFTGRMSDLIGFLTLPAIVRRLRDAAPGIALDIVHLSPERTLKALDEDELDFALSMGLSHPRSVRAQPVFQDHMCCVMGTSHPLASKKLTLKGFLAYPHLRVSMSPTDIRFVDDVLAEHGQHRNVAVNIPHWLLIPPMLSQSDLLAVTSRKLADRYADTGLVIKPLPFESAPFPWTMYWHRRYDKSAAHVWIRQTLSEVCARL